MCQRYVHALAILLLLTATAAVADSTTIHVSPVAGDAAASGTALLNALAAINDNSASKTYVIKIDPGTYNLGSSVLAMKPYVDVEGSGQGSTVLTGPGNGDSNYLTAIVQAAAPAELRNLQVVSQGAGQTTSIGIFVSQAATTIRDVTIVAGGASNSWGIRSIGASPTIENVTINVSGSGYQAYGIGTTSSSANPILKHTVINVSGSASYSYGIYTDGVAAPQEMRDLEVSVVTGSFVAYGLYVDSSGSGQTYVLAGSTVNVTSATYNYGLVFYGSSGGSFNLKTTFLRANGIHSWGVYAPAPSTYGLSFNQCEVAGNTYSIYATNTPVYVGASRIAGAVLGGTVACAGAYNVVYVPLNSSCH